MASKTPGGQAASEKFLKQQAQKQGAGATNAPGHTDQGVPGDAKVAADSYASTVGIDNKATNVPGERGDVGQKVGEKPDAVSGSSMKSICDLQEKFRSAIHEYPKVITTTQKLLKASQILDFPVLATTQLKGKLGETCPELGLDAEGGVKTQAHADKSAFSMWIPEIQDAFAKLSNGGKEKMEVVIVGIESHICVTQTTLDLLREGHKVYVIADGVSSCNPQEVPIALSRLRAEGAVVTTSESWLYECMGDAGIGEFKQMAGLVKEYSGKTRESLQALCKF